LANILTNVISCLNFGAKMGQKQSLSEDTTPLLLTRRPKSTESLQLRINSDDVDRSNSIADVIETVGKPVEVPITLESDSLLIKNADYYKNKIATISKTHAQITYYSDRYPVFKFDNDFVDELVGVDFFMWANILSFWNESDKEHKSLHKIYCAILSELLIGMILRADIFSQNQLLAKKVCYAMSVTNCHTCIYKYCDRHFIVNVLDRLMNTNNFDTHSKIIRYLVYSGPKVKKTMEDYQWSKITDFINTDSLREYYIKILTENRNTTNIMSKMLAFKYDSDESYEKIITACIDNFEDVAYLRIVPAFLNNKSYTVKNVDIATRLLQKLSSKITPLDKITIDGIKFSYCKINYFIVFALEHGESAEHLAHCCLKSGKYDAFATILSVEPDAINTNHYYSFTNIILNYLKLEKGSCLDFIKSWDVLMTSQNINELIHIAIDNPNTTLDDVQTLISKLKTKESETTTSTFNCSVQAHNKFYSVLSQHYVNICIQ
jgi:hypothetical protein